MAHSRASRGLLRQSTSSRECASLARQCLFLTCLHSLRQRTAPVSLRARTLCAGSLASSWLAGECVGGQTALVRASASCADCSPPLAFFCKLRGTAPEPLRPRARRLTGAYLYPIYFPQITRISSHISSDVFPSVATFTSAAASYFGLRFSISSSIYPTFIFPFSTGLSVLSFTRS